MPITCARDRYPHGPRLSSKGSGSSMELEPGPEDAPKVAHAQGNLSVQEMLPYTVGCRLMLACGAVFEFLQNRDRISPNAGGDGPWSSCR
jgi:hypothetical protein